MRLCGAREFKPVQKFVRLPRRPRGTTQHNKSVASSKSPVPRLAGARTRRPASLKRGSIGLPSGRFQRSRGRAVLLESQSVLSRCFFFNLV